MGSGQRSSSLRGAHFLLRRADRFWFVARDAPDRDQAFSEAEAEEQPDSRHIRNAICAPESAKSADTLSESWFYYCPFSRFAVMRVAFTAATRVMPAMKTPAAKQVRFIFWHVRCHPSDIQAGVNLFGLRRSTVLRSGERTAKKVAVVEGKNLRRITMPDPPPAVPRAPKRVGIAADHGGFELKQYLAGILRDAHYEVVDFGDGRPRPDDDYPDFVAPLARAVAGGQVDRGAAICGSGVG